ncbi:MAG TPA: septal ring lytic transglycosylase RlpA family protein, partial [Egibacteraceae bacterium]|nr:septal ring lytic transglycosylase RlpA family protein [Egibacteraceae bacterium]
PVGEPLRGPASWYGAEFAGRRTACGQRFDPAARTLASRELRCGTVVVITGPGGARVEATVTDWGPAPWTGRRFDLSQATFAAVAPLSAGVVPVTVTVVE